MSEGWSTRTKRPPVVLLGMLLVSTYFVVHLVFGTHGLLAKERLISRSTDLEREVAVLEAVRSRLAQDVAALGREPPAPDVVVEVARSVLGLVMPGDRVVLRQRRAATP